MDTYVANAGGAVVRGDEYAGKIAFPKYRCGDAATPIRLSSGGILLGGDGARVLHPASASGEVKVNDWPLHLGFEVADYQFVKDSSGQIFALTTHARGDHLLKLTESGEIVWQHKLWSDLRDLNVSGDPMQIGISNGAVAVSVYRTNLDVSNENAVVFFDPSNGHHKQILRLNHPEGTWYSSDFFYTMGPYALALSATGFFRTCSLTDGELNVALRVAGGGIVKTFPAASWNESQQLAAFLLPNSTMSETGSVVFYNLAGGATHLLHPTGMNANIFRDVSFDPVTGALMALYQADHFGDKGILIIPSDQLDQHLVKTEIKVDVHIFHPAGSGVTKELGS